MSSVTERKRRFLGREDGSDVLGLGGGGGWGHLSRGKMVELELKRREERRLEEAGSSVGSP